MEKAVDSVQVHETKEAPPPTSVVNNEVPRCYPLELSAELSNMIYSLVLTQPHRYVVSEYRCNEPPLLQTCTQIRDEASSIFFTPRTWARSFCIQLYDHKLQPQSQHWIWNKVYPNDLAVESSLDWHYYRDLQPWLELCHRGVLDPYAFRSENYDDMPALENLLEISAEMRKVPWKTAKRVLKKSCLCLGVRKGHSRFDQLDILAKTRTTVREMTEHDCYQSQPAIIAERQAKRHSANLS